MPHPLDSCHECGSREDLRHDQKYNQLLCVTHFRERRQQAVASGDAAWVRDNGLLRELTMEERDRLGVSGNSLKCRCGREKNMMPNQLYYCLGCGNQETFCGCGA